MFFSSLLIFIGAGLGGIARHAMNVSCTRLLPISLPVSTLLINLLGSFAMGCLAGWFAFRSAGLSQHMRLFLTSGILGGFTTFSTFTLDALLLFEQGNMVAAGAYILTSVLGSLILGYIGLLYWR